MISNFKTWLETNREIIGDKWYSQLLKETKKADTDTAGRIIGLSLWMLNMAANLGVAAGVGPNTVNLQHVNPKIDRESTEKLLHVISSCLCLQYLPKER